MQKRQTWAQWASNRPAQHWAGEAIIVIALAMFGCSAYFNWAYTSSLATDANAKLAMGVAGVSIAAMLAALSIGKHFLTGDDQGSMRRKVFLLVTVLAVAEVWNAMGAISTKRGDAVGARVVEQTSYANAAADKARAEADLKSLRQTAPAATIKAQMQDYERRAWFAGTANCTQPGSMGSACRRYLSLAGDHGIAVERGRLDKRIADANIVMANASGAAHNAADPQSVVAGSVAGLFGVHWKAEDIGLLAPLGIALVLMLGGWIGVEAGFVVRGVNWQRIEHDGSPKMAPLNTQPSNLVTFPQVQMTQPVGDGAKAQDDTAWARAILMAKSAA